MSKNKHSQEVVLNDANDVRVSIPLLPDPLDYVEHLDQCHDYLSWLQALFVAIQSDPDIEPNFNIHNLASIGGYLSQSWLNEMDGRRRNFKEQLDDLV
jgi:hypothetical protein